MLSADVHHLSLRKQRNPFAAAPAAAFTLLEVLMVLALIGLMTSVFVVGYTKVFDDKPATPDQVFWGAVTAARKQALMSGREVRLQFMAASSGEGASESWPSLVATWENGGQKIFPFEDMGDVLCEFLSTQKGTSAILVGGQVVETQTIPWVRFFGDGTCIPFRVQFRIGGLTHTQAIDPWTCAQMLDRTDEGEGR